MKSVSWNVKVHDSEGSSPYIHAETRVESLKLPNLKERRVGAGNHPPKQRCAIFSRRGRTVLNCFRTISSATRKAYSGSHPRPGYSARSAAQRILTSRKGEKIRFLKQKKHSFLALRGCQNLPKDKGEKEEKVGKP